VIHDTWALWRRKGAAAAFVRHWRGEIVGLGGNKFLLGGHGAADSSCVALHCPDATLHLRLGSLGFDVGFDAGLQPSFTLRWLL
jgi:hypothetical protein